MTQRKIFLKRIPISILLTWVLLLITETTWAFPKYLSDYFAQRHTSLPTKASWQEYMKDNKKLFPPIIEDKTQIYVVINKEKISFKEKTLSIDVSSRQFFIPAPLEKAKETLSKPSLFEHMYGLDGPSQIGASQYDGGDHLIEFKAHILKTLPIIPDQDYILNYKWSQDKELWFQNVTQVKENSPFALRSTLIVLEPYQQGTLFREVGIVYLKSALLRALGGPIRTMVKGELKKLSKSFKCTVTSTDHLNKKIAKKCWEES